MQHDGILDEVANNQVYKFSYKLSIEGIRETSPLNMREDGLSTWENWSLPQLETPLTSVNKVWEDLMLHFGLSILWRLKGCVTRKCGANFFQFLFLRKVKFFRIWMGVRNVSLSTSCKKIGKSLLMIFPESNSKQRSLKKDEILL